MKSNQRQRTIAAPALFRGVGLHTGVPVEMSVFPAAVNSGIHFVFQEVDIPAHYSCVSRTQFCTVLSHQGVSVSTVEHFLAACSGLHLDNLTIYLSGPEIPIMDGSSSNFYFLLKSIGVVDQEQEVSVIMGSSPLEVVQDDAYIRYTPATKLSIDYTLTYDHPWLSAASHFYYDDHMDGFSSLARSRTFGFVSQLEELRSKGFAKGASIENTLGLTDSGCVEGSQLRYRDECVRHKILDMIGDLFLLGGRCVGHFEARGSGHTLNLLMAQALGNSVSVDCLKLGV